MSYLDEMFGLNGKTAVVSGGAGAIGTVMSEALLKAGAKVMIWSRSQESINTALEKMEEVPESDGRVAGMQVDAGVESEVKAALEKTVSSFSTPDILINGVGGNIGKAPLIEQDMELFEKVLHMNLVALDIAVKALGHEMRAPPPFQQSALCHCDACLQRHLVVRELYTAKALRIPQCFVRNTVELQYPRLEVWRQVGLP